MDAGPSYNYQSKNALPTIYMVIRKRKQLDAAAQYLTSFYASISRK
jgi:hypothetical protein